ncbi:hypothetical protein [Paenibacillus sp. LHD-38]|uniref:hypothetical protein n=1 Tax=Paenibacillus sp. LHD-38 TaxID=3072143 RepID=UPI00280C952C|nr:hypothetical protein [Paenibacillus sp. LHD-38]MDQ8738447.1 hypothetical protein [Paenibacillus sp. LHD-38]
MINELTIRFIAASFIPHIHIPPKSRLSYRTHASTDCSLSKLILILFDIKNKGHLFNDEKKFEQAGNYTLNIQKALDVAEELYVGRVMIKYSTLRVGNMPYVG